MPEVWRWQSARACPEKQWRFRYEPYGPHTVLGWVLARTVHTPPKEDFRSYGPYSQDPRTPKLVGIQYSQDPRTPELLEDQYSQDSRTSNFWRTNVLRFPGPQLSGGPVFPSSPEVKIEGCPIFPGSQDPKIGRFPIFPGSPEIKIGSFPIFGIFPAIQIGRFPILINFNIHFIWFPIKILIFH